MNSTRWRQIEELFHVAASRPREDRASFLEEACGGDHVLRQEVQALLETRATAEGFLVEPVVVRPADDPGSQRLSTDLVGRQLGHYRILSLLNKGGMAEVFVAEDVRLGRQVAIKVLPPEFYDDEERGDRFLREARAASVLNHPNIVTVYDVGRAEVGYFIAMEFIPGRTLRRYVDERPPLEVVASLVAQAAKALGCAHAAGIIHRDVKPENIMVRDDGYVKVVDFGIARIVRPDTDGAGAGTPSTFARAGMVVGTWRYMSPEQVTAQPLSGATDVYSLGVVLYELLTGRYPIESESVLTHIAALAAVDPIAPSRHSLEVPQVLDELILQMLDRNPTGRPTADEVGARLHALTGPSRIAPSATTHRVVVGREGERALLHAAFARIEDTRSRLVLLAGEAGIGKTTLAEHFLAEVTDRNPRARIARGRCSERLAGTGAYLPIIEAVHTLMGRSVDTAAARVVQTLAPTWYGRILTTTDSAVETPQSAAPPPPERMKRELVALLQELARQQPLIVFLDDLHWVDASTVDVMSYLLDRAGTAVLLVGSYRPSEIDAERHPFVDLRLDMMTRGLCAEIALESLRLSDIERYVELSFPNHGFPSGFSALVYNRTEGHPLFMADMLRDLKERGVIVQRDGAWRLKDTLETIDQAVPQSVQSMVTRKLDRLDEEDRRLLVAASVQGDEFDVVVISAALGADARQIEEHIEPLERQRGIVRFMGDIELPDHTLTARYRFSHALYQEALHSSLRPARRAALSRAVADALLLHHRPRSAHIAPQLALLFESARDFGAAAQHFLTASSTVLQRGAPLEAATLARRGLSLLERLPADGTRDGVELSLRLALGAALNVQSAHRSQEVMVVFDQAREVAARIGQQQAVFQVLVGHVWSHLAAGHCLRARELAGECLRQANAMQIPECRAGGHLQVGVTSEYIGDLRGAQQHYREAIALSDRADQSELVRLLFLHPHVYARSELANSLFHSGQFSAGFAMMTDALGLARRVDHVVTTGLVLIRKLNLCFRGGDVEKAARYVDEFAALQDRHPTTSVIWVPLMRGWLEGRRENGSVESAAAQINESIARCGAIGYKSSVSALKQILAEIFLLHGRFDAATATADEGLVVSQETGEVQYVPELLRIKAACALASPHSDEAAGADAEHALRESIRLADEQGGGFWALRATTTLAERMAASGRRAEAETLMYDRCSRFDHEQADVHDLVQARALLAALRTPAA